MTDAVSESSQPFSSRAVLLMVLVGVFAFAAYVVLSTYAPDLRSGRDGRGHALSRSAAGFAGLVELLRDCDVPVRISRGHLPGDGPMRILTPEPGVDAKDFAKAIDPGKARGVTLVVLPKWTFGPVLGHPGWVSRAGVLDDDSVVAMLSARLRPGIIRSSGITHPHLTATTASPIAAGQTGIGAVDQLQTLTGAGFEPLLVDEQGRWLLVSAPGRPNLMILSDPDLLNTQGIKDLARARLAVDLINALRGDAPVVFDVSINGFEGSRSLLKLALEPPFLGATLCALIAVVLIGWQAATRFGAPRAEGRAFALGKTALADNSAALLRLAGREPRMAWPYAELTLKAVARAVGAPRSLDQAQTLALLDRLSAKAGAAEAPSALLAAADGVRDNTTLLRLARRLYDFRRGMTRERD